MLISDLDCKLTREPWPVGFYTLVLSYVFGNVKSAVFKLPVTEKKTRSELLAGRVVRACLNSVQPVETLETYPRPTLSIKMILWSAAGEMAPSTGSLIRTA